MVNGFIDPVPGLRAQRLEGLLISQGDDRSYSKLFQGASQLEIERMEEEGK